MNIEKYLLRAAVGPNIGPKIYNTLYGQLIRGFFSKMVKYDTYCR